MDVAVALGCLHRVLNDPGANPFIIEFAFALSMLFGMFSIWRRENPEPRRVLRCFMGASSGIAFLIMMIVCMFVNEEQDVIEGLRIVLQATMATSAALFAEIVLSPRRELIASATASP